MSIYIYITWLLYIGNDIFVILRTSEGLVFRGLYVNNDGDYKSITFTKNYDNNLDCVVSIDWFSIHVLMWKEKQNICHSQYYHVIRLKVFLGELDIHFLQISDDIVWKTEICMENQKPKKVSKFASFI